MNSLDIKISPLDGWEKKISTTGSTNYDSEYDDINTLLADICDALSESEVVEFLVSGFGQNNWPVDVATDMLCVVEQLNDILEKISVGRFDFYLDFYEQGMERKLEFRSLANTVEVKCFSDTTWEPNVANVCLDKAQVRDMFFNLKLTFCSVAKIVCPLFCSHSWFSEWENTGQA